MKYIYYMWRIEYVGVFGGSLILEKKRLPFLSEFRTHWNSQPESKAVRDHSSTLIAEKAIILKSICEHRRLNPKA